MFITEPDSFFIYKYLYIVTMYITTYNIIKVHVVLAKLSKIYQNNYTHSNIGQI